MDEVGGALVAIALVLDRGVRAGGFHHRHLRPVLPPVRRHHRGRDGDLLLRLADPEPGALRPAVQAARRASDRAHRLPVRVVAGFLPRLQLVLRPAVGRLRQADAPAGPPRGVVLAGLCRADRAHRLAVQRAPTGFIPQQDQGYLITVLQLPPGSSLARTDAVMRQATEIILETPGVAHAVPFAGFDAATFTNAPNAGAIFMPLQPFDERAAQGPERRTDPRPSCASAWPRSRAPSASSSRRRRCAASALPAASR